MTDHVIYTNTRGDTIRLNTYRESQLFELEVTHNDGGSADVVYAKIAKSEIPQLLRNLAEATGTEVLIIEKPVGINTRFEITVMPTDQKVQITKGFNLVERLDNAEIIRLIWNLATAAASAKSQPDLTLINQLRADLAKAGFPTTAVVEPQARNLLRLGYRKDPDKAVSDKPLVHIFNEMAEAKGLH